MPRSVLRRPDPFLLGPLLLLSTGLACDRGEPAAVDSPNTPPESLVAAGGETLAAAAVEKEEVDPILGAPLVVNGEKIPLDAIRRRVVLVSNGRTLYELAKIQVYIDQEIQRQIEQEGKTAADFVIEQTEIDAAVSRARRTNELQGGGDGAGFDPTTDPGWLDQLRQTQLFKKVFLPENPHQYPMPTLDAFRSTEQGEQILQVLRDDWDKKTAAAGDAPPVDEADPGLRIFEMLLNRQVLDYLHKSAAVQEVEDGLPGHLLGIVNGVEITVQEIWDQVKDSIAPTDVWTAKQWLVNTTILRQALEESGFLMSPEEAAAIFEEQAAPYRESLFSIEKMALTVKKYPTLGMYKTYQRLYESFQRQIAAEITDEALDEQGRRRTAAIVSFATVDVDIILLSAYDFQKKQWIEDGWEKAKARATEVSEKLVAGADWSTLLDEYSGFYDPPLPAGQETNPDYQKLMFHKGRLKGWIRNQLAGKLDEPDFRLFLTGTSITDILFFEQKIDSIENPIRGPYGYYIPKLLHRSAPTVSLSAKNSKDRTYLEQDYVAERLRKWTQELIAKAEITGL
ncbi:MAG: hypothetical protein AB1726_06360 [Planctomycetota bacterium]